MHNLREGMNNSGIIFIKKENNTPRVVKEDLLKIRGIVDTLGILPTIESKVVICVEGENDVNFIMNVNQFVQELREIIDLKEHKISILPLSGSQLIRWVNRNYLSNSNVVEFHIYDADKQEYKDVINRMEKDNDGRRCGVITERLEMENYISPTLINEHFNIELDIQNEEWGNLDVPKYLLDRILTNIKCTNERENKIKMILNGSITKKITKRHLEEMGCYEEVKSWFEQVSSLYFGNGNKSWKRTAKTID